MNVLPERKPIRLPNFDYRTSGAYYVTIVTQDRACLFGEVLNGRMELNGVGNIVRDEWTKTPMMRPDILLDDFVIMPNHFHGIFCIVGRSDSSPRLSFARIFEPPTAIMSHGTVTARGSRTVACGSRTVACGSPAGDPYGMGGGSTVGSVVNGFKSAVTTRVNTVRDSSGTPVWQRNYYEHIIRDESDLNRIRKYIRENPTNWESDEMHVKP